ncbi:MAG: TetR family transcriptional regulator [Streptosporangiales bacterium]|nr:TetR family transcriptional regulator [Streptosporangiales bacterium]
MAAALELFGSHAGDEISIDDVAERAGASRALVYHYFGSKQELYLAALRSAAQQLTDLFTPPETGKPLDRLSTSLSHYFDFVERHEAGFVALLRGAPANRTDEVSQVVDEVRRLLTNRVLQEFGVTTPQPILRITMRAWISAVETAGLDWLESKDLPRKDLESLLVDHLVALLQTTARRDPQTAHLLKTATTLQTTP